MGLPAQRILPGVRDSLGTGAGIFNVPSSGSPGEAATVYDLAAEYFNVPVETLSADSTPSVAPPQAQRNEPKNRNTAQRASLLTDP